MTEIQTFQFILGSPVSNLKIETNETQTTPGLLRNGSQPPVEEDKKKEESDDEVVLHFFICLYGVPISMFYIC